jgi:hypothetical protein
LLDEEAPIDAIKDGYRSLMATKPIGNKILLAYRYEDIIEIYDLNSGLNKAVHGPDQIVLDFIPTKIHTSRHVFMTTKDTRRAYARPTVTNKYIYIPYSGQRKGSKSHEERFKWNYQNVIHVFDWDGNPIKRLLLNDYVSSIAISEDDKILYAFNPETGYLIKANLN